MHDLEYNIFVLRIQSEISLDSKYELERRRKMLALLRSSQEVRD